MFLIFIRMRGLTLLFLLQPVPDGRSGCNLKLKMEITDFRVLTVRFLWKSAQVSSLQPNLTI